LAGLPVLPGKAAVVSEEAPAHWLGRAEKLGIGNHVCWLCRPFRGKPTPSEWLALLDRLLALRRAHGIALVAIDPLAMFHPGRDENHAGLMLEAMSPLHQLTAEGLSVLVLHHPGRGASRDGHSCRGSGALMGFADILVEMYHVGRVSGDDRRRRLVAFSRFDETPRRLVIELNAEGTDYLCHGAGGDDEFLVNWGPLRAALADAPRKLTRRAVARRWPGGPPPPSTSLWRWLDQAVSHGLVCRDGGGRRRDPYRYWLREREEQWRQSPEGRRMLEEEQQKREIMELILEANRRALAADREADRPCPPSPDGDSDEEALPCG
jgi:hypothetical protein